MAKKVTKTRTKTTNTQYNKNRARPTSAPMLGGNRYGCGGKIKK